MPCFGGHLFKVGYVLPYVKCGIFYVYNVGLECTG